MVHITYPILCMSYSYTYITFMVIYYTICYVIFSCTVIMYCHRVLFSRTVIMYCSCTNFIYCIHVLFMYYFHLLFSCYTFYITFSFMYCTCSYTFRVLYFILSIYCIHVLFHVLCTFHILSYCTFHILYYHINFSDHFTFLYIFIYHVGSYNLMLQNLSSHSSDMLLRSYHIFSHVIFKSLVLCFMLA